MAGNSYVKLYNPLSCPSSIGDDDSQGELSPLSWPLFWWKEVRMEIGVLRCLIAVVAVAFLFVIFGCGEESTSYVSDPLGENGSAKFDARVEQTSTDATLTVSADIQSDRRVIVRGRA